MVRQTANSGSSSGSKERLSKADWVSAAKDALIQAGVTAVKIDRLANTLKVTRGSFYWHFASRQALLAELLKSWETETVECFQEVLDRGIESGMDEFLALASLWLGDGPYDPAYDSAIRDWAGTSSEVAESVRRVDRQRIDIIRQIFVDMGFEDEEAFLRARLAYFAQVGYFTLGLDESKEERLTRVPFNIKVLTTRLPND